MYKKIKQTSIRRCKSGHYSLIFSLAFVIMIALFLLYNNPTKYSISTMLLTSEISYMPTNVETEKCYDSMKHLTLKLNKAERALRSTLRLRNKDTRSMSYDFIKESPIQYIAGCKATQGSETTEWGGSVTLWGVLPLWRATLPPDTVLALRPPTPTDCWPFRGSYGELVIKLSERTLVDTISVEHVRPDTARSAPKHFSLFGIFENGTWIKAANDVYKYNAPAKQYFSLMTNVPLKQVVFRVLSNQGNAKYTCIYRVHLYTRHFNK